MTYDTPGVAFNALESIYEDQKKRADEYVLRDNVNQFIADRMYDELDRMYSALTTLEPTTQDPLWHVLAGHLNRLLQHDSTLSGVYILLRLQPHGDNFGRINHNPYGDSSK